MAETNEILHSATKLGALIGRHPTVATYRELTRQLDLDISARNLLGQFEQLMETLAMKEAQMQPVEVAEKQQLRTLEQSIAIHPLLKKLMAAQVEYMDMMRKVQEAINAGLGSGQAEEMEAPAAAPASKLILET